MEAGILPVRNGGQKGLCAQQSHRALLGIKRIGGWSLNLEKQKLCVCVCVCVCVRERERERERERRERSHEGRQAAASEWMKESFEMKRWRGQNTILFCLLLISLQYVSSLLDSKFGTRTTAESLCIYMRGTALRSYVTHGKNNFKT